MDDVLSRHECDAFPHDLPKGKVVGKHLFPIQLKRAAHQRITRFERVRIKGNFKKMGALVNVWNDQDHLQSRDTGMLEQIRPLPTALS